MKRYFKKAWAMFEKMVLSKFLSKYKLNYKNKGVINFIDVGSVGGLPEPWNSNAYLIKYLLNFEPNDAIKEGPNFMTYNTAVWEKSEIRPFYIYKGFKATGSSLFKQNYDYVSKNYNILKKRGIKRLALTWFERSKLIKETSIKCETIDLILKENFDAKEFHFMKIDAQGAELNILKGAEEFLKTSCIGLHLELFTVPLYEGIALMDEVKIYLENLGFELVKEYPPHGTFNSQHDCVFIKERTLNSALTSIKEVYKLN